MVVLGAGGQPHELSRADLQVLGLVAMGGGWSATFGDKLESAGHFHPEAERLRAELRRQVPALGVQPPLAKVGVEMGILAYV